ncbi:Transmembrane and TPR repeat-containing protein [Symbiodinium microadriaticum]|uniref:Transmembrane and TPR repeat-containing protein n=1 Tax=Symbiodinium microadriaticum TaxID=2951 RepID=A0A1Q9EQD1_SYMMI|nr:Transmembrane and TPR repeat-containing protein [Symbiodinium microadriaticum]
MGLQSEVVLGSISNAYGLLLASATRALAGLRRARARHRGSAEAPILGLAIFVLSFLPMTNILFPIGTLVAERLLYLPSIGFLIVAVCFARDHVEFGSGSRQIRECFCSSHAMLLTFLQAQSVLARGSICRWSAPQPLLARGKMTGGAPFRNPHNLPVKDCVVCGRPFTWRKKWERCWDEVQTCSNRCRTERRAKSSAGKKIAGGMVAGAAAAITSVTRAAKSEDSEATSDEVVDELDPVTRSEEQGVSPATSRGYAGDRDGQAEAGNSPLDEVRPAKLADAAHK